MTSTNLVTGSTPVTGSEYYKQTLNVTASTGLNLMPIACQPRVVMLCSRDTSPTLFDDYAGFWRCFPLSSTVRGRIDDIMDAVLDKSDDSWTIGGVKTEDRYLLMTRSEQGGTVIFDNAALKMQASQAGISHGFYGVSSIIKENFEIPPSFQKGQNEVAFCGISVDDRANLVTNTLGPGFAPNTVEHLGAPGTYAGLGSVDWLYTPGPVMLSTLLATNTSGSSGAYSWGDLATLAGLHSVATDQCDLGVLNNRDGVFLTFEIGINNGEPAIFLSAGRDQWFDGPGSTYPANYAVRTQTAKMDSLGDYIMSYNSVRFTNDSAHSGAPYGGTMFPNPQSGDIDPEWKVSRSGSASSRQATNAVPITAYALLADYGSTGTTGELTRTCWSSPGDGFQYLASVTGQDFDLDGIVDSSTAVEPQVYCAFHSDRVIQLFTIGQSDWTEIRVLDVSAIDGSFETGKTYFGTLTYSDSAGASRQATIRFTRSAINAAGLGQHIMNINNYNGLVSNVTVNYIYGSDTDVFSDTPDAYVDFLYGFIFRGNDRYDGASVRVGQR